MYTFFCSDPKGKSIERTHEGKLKWIDTEKLLKVKNGYDNTVDMVKFYRNMKGGDDIRMLTRSYETPM